MDVAFISFVPLKMSSRVVIEEIFYKNYFVINNGQLVFIRKAKRKGLFVK